MKLMKKPANPAKSLYPILHVTNSLKEYHHDLVQSEVASLLELSNVSKSFGSVIGEADSFQETLQDFGDTFSNINQVSGQFETVKHENSPIRSPVPERGGILKVQFPAGAVLF